MRCRNIHESQVSCREEHARKQLSWGIALILIGAVFLLDRLGILDLQPFIGLQLEWWHLLPLLLAVAGLISIISARTSRRVVKGLFNVILGLWLYACLEHLWGWSFRSTWPVILIALGLSMMLGGLCHTGNGSNRESTP
jgi:hypothetical protein